MTDKDREIIEKAAEIQCLLFHANKGKRVFRKTTDSILSIAEIIGGMDGVIYLNKCVSEYAEKNKDKF